MLPRATEAYVSDSRSLQPRSIVNKHRCATQAGTCRKPKVVITASQGPQNLSNTAAITAPGWVWGASWTKEDQPSPVQPHDLVFDQSSSGTKMWLCP